MTSLHPGRQYIAAAFLGALLAAASAAPAVAADAPLPPRATVTEVYRPVVRHYHGCPDGYSCYALYGAYGPYGGKAFWGAYTGWYR